MSVYRVGGNKSSQNVFPSVRPTLDLDFANSKTLDPRITFTRASGGSYVGADGLIKYAGVNEARFDHDPSTGESLGLLIEEARTNQVTDSIVLSNMPDKTNVTVVDNAIISPDGTQNASKIIETNFLGSRSLSRLNVSTLANTTYTISGYFKRGERKNVGISFRNVTFWGGGPTAPFATFNLEESGRVLVTANLNAVSIVNVGNGWYRCSITATRDSNGTITSGIAVGPVNDSGASPYQGLEGYGFYAWGLQFEAGTSPLSFIPTLGSTRTRAGESISITGNNFSEWYRQDEGTIFMDFKNTPNSSLFPSLFVFTDSSGPGTNRILVTKFADTFNIRISDITGGITQSAYNIASGFKVGDNLKVCRTYGLRDYFGSVNGSNPPQQFLNVSKAAPPKSLNQLFIGSSTSGGSPINAPIKRFTYFPKRLPNEQLIALTR
jgi:hypothetical protein